MPRLAPLSLSRPLARPGAIAELLNALGLSMPENPHVTLIVSRKLVDWDDSLFVPEPFGLKADLGAPRLDVFGPQNDVLALVFENAVLHARNAALQRGGAGTDWPDYHPHLSLGPAPAGWQEAARGLDLPRALPLGPERRKVPSSMAHLAQFDHGT